MLLQKVEQCNSRITELRDERDEIEEKLQEAQKEEELNKSGIRDDSQVVLEIDRIDAGQALFRKPMY
jgi:hypothetical protein